MLPYPFLKKTIPQDIISFPGDSKNEYTKYSVVSF
jgi:hypothetical protein